MQDPQVSEGLGIFKDQETHKKEEAGQVMLGSEATARSLHFTQRVMRRHRRVCRGILLLLFKSGVLRYNPHQ